MATQHPGLKRIGEYWHFSLKVGEGRASNRGWLDQMDEMDRFMGDQLLKAYGLADSAHREAVVFLSILSVSATLGRMTRIHEAIGSMEGMVRQIGAATEEQSNTAAEVARRVEDTSREVGQNAAATHQLSATVQEISRTASDLARVSEDLARDLGRFRF